MSDEKERRVFEGVLGHEDEMRSQDAYVVDDNNNLRWWQAWVQGLYGKRVRITVEVLALVAMLAAPAHAEPPAIYAADGTFLGVLSANKYDPNSVADDYGRYGSPYSPDSINNPYGKYGDPYSPDSVTNPYATSDVFAEER